MDFQRVRLCCINKGIYRLETIYPQNRYSRGTSYDIQAQLFWARSTSLEKLGGSSWPLICAESTCTPG
jgi:hypothetical protein